jgi:hypothetical protein
MVVVPQRLALRVYKHVCQSDQRHIEHARHYPNPISRQWGDALGRLHNIVED